MKKYLYIILALALVVTFVTPAYAAARSLTLESIVFIPAKGVVFTFIPTGEFKPAELTGFARISSETYLLDCQLNDENEVKCVGERGLSRFTGQAVTGQVAGFAFAGEIRTAGTAYCYTVFQKITGGWEAVGTSCGTGKARKGDWILFNGVMAVFNPQGPAGAGFYLEKKLAR